MAVIRHIHMGYSSLWSVVGRNLAWILPLLLWFPISAWAEEAESSVAPESGVEVEYVLDQPTEDEELNLFVQELNDSDVERDLTPSNLEAIQSHIGTLYASGYFSQIRAQKLEISGETRLRFVLAPKIRIDGIIIIGNKTVDEESILNVLTLQENGAVFEGDLAREIKKIERLLLLHGFPNALVLGRLVELTPYRAFVNFFIDERDPVRVTKISFEGSPHFPKEILEKKFPLRIGNRVDTDRLRNAVRKLRSFYRAKQFEEVRILLPESSLETEKGRDLLLKGIVHLDIRSGKPIEFKFLGNHLYSPKELRAAIEPDLAPILSKAETLNPSDGREVPGHMPRNVLFGGLPHKDAREAEDESMGSALMTSYTNASCARLADRLRDFYKQEGYLFVKIRYKVIQRERKKTILFQIRENKRVEVEDIRFSGNHEVNSNVLKQELQAFVREKLTTGEEDEMSAPDPGNLDHAVYREHSYYRTRFKPSPPPFSRPAHIQADRIYLPEIYQEASENLKVFYMERGYLEANISTPHARFQGSRSRVGLELSIDEGRRTHIEEIRVAGQEAFGVEEIFKQSGLRIGQPLNPLRFSEIEKKLRDFYAASGYIYADVDVSYTTPEDPGQARVLIAVREGLQAKYGQIVVAGARKTRASVIKRELTFRPFDVYDPAEIEESSYFLRRMDIFQSTRIQPWEPEKEEAYKRIVVRVKERTTSSYELSMGVATDDGLRGGAGYLYRNLFGIGLEFRARIKANHRIMQLLDPGFREVYRRKSFKDLLERKVSAGLRYPSIYGTHIGTNLEVVHLRRQERAYGLDKNSIVLSFDTEIGRQLSLVQINEWSLQDAESTYVPGTGVPDSVRPDERPPSSSSIDYYYRYRPPEGRSWEYSPKFRLTYDLRDSLFEPTRGFVFTLLAEWFETLSGLNADLMRNQVGASVYIPLSFGRKPWVVKVAAKGGWIHNFGNRETPIDKLFKLGGRTTIRGFSEQQVYPLDLGDEERQIIIWNEEPSDGGETFLLYKVDLRVPIYKQFQAGAFLDSGGLWRRPGHTHLNLLDYKNSAGGGIHYRTPVGDVSLEIGWNLAPQRDLDEEPWRFHFNIGLF